MKKLLITEANTSLGQSICAQFDKAGEWDVVATKRAVPSVDLISRASGTAEIPGVKTFIGGYHIDPVEFKKEVLEADVIICPLSDNIEEAAAAIRMLSNTTFEWEKTFVLVSSTMTWADTYNSQKAEAEAERIAERRALLEAGEELPDDEDEAAAAEEEEAPVFTEDQYLRRVPHRMFDHWKELERFTKQANSETLHTYVINGGLQYGHGEDVLHHLMRAAWHGRPLPLYTHGSNVLPMIHVDDLANLVFKVGSSYDVLSQRYIFGVDKGNCTLGAVVKAIGIQLGVGQTYAVSEARHHTVKHIEQMTVDLRCEAGTINELIEEDEWICPDGFVTHIEKICAEYQKYRKVQPIRAVILGAPLVGKTHLAEQLSKDYRVNHLKLADMISSYEEYVADMKTKLKAYRVEKAEGRRLAAKEEQRRVDREAAEEAEAARLEEEENGGGGGAAANAGGGGEDSDEDEDGNTRTKNEHQDAADENDGEKKDDEDEFEDDDETFIDFAVEAPANSGNQSPTLEDGEEGEGDEGAGAAGGRNAGGGDEGEEEEEPVEVDEAADDDEEDEFLNNLKESITHAVKVLACRIKPLTAEAPTDEDGNPIEPPVNVTPKRPLMGKPYGDASPETIKQLHESPTKKKASVVAGEDAETDAAAAAATAADKVVDKKKTPEEEAAELRLKDAALATIVRWRISNRDCRCQGYVLDGFPKTVRQASLTFMVGEGGIPIPDPEEAAEEELPEGDELRELMMAAVDDKALPENVFVLNADEAQLLARCEALRSASSTSSSPAKKKGDAATQKDIDILARFYRRLKEHKLHFSATVPQPHKNLPNWFRSIMSNTEGNPREATVHEIDTTHESFAAAAAAAATLGGSSNEDNGAPSSSYCLAKVADALGPHRFYRPTPSEIVEEAKQQQLEEERRALAHIHAEEEARRVEAEVLAAKKRETAKHERRYRSIQEEQAEVAATINEMPMQTYLMQYVVPPLTKGIAHCVQLRPEDPVDTLGDFLFDYEPHRKL